jgi:hypothetical protein
MNGCDLASTHGHRAAGHQNVSASGTADIGPAGLVGRLSVEVTGRDFGR